MPLPKHAYCESEIDEDLVASSQAGPDETSSSSTTKPRNPTKRTTGTNSDSAQSTKTHDTSGSTLSRNSTSKTSVSSRNASADRALKNPKSTNADTRRQKTTPSTSVGGAKHSPEAIPSTAGHYNSRPTLIGSVRPPHASEMIGGYYVPDISPVSMSPTATFAPSSYHAPPTAPLARPRSGSASRSRPSSGHWETPDGIWLPPGEPAPSARPTQVHAHSTPQIPSQQHTLRPVVASQAAAGGTWVRDDAAFPGSYSGVAQPRSRPPLQHQAGAQVDGRRASMYGAPVVQHYQASPIHHDPARAMMPPPQGLPVRTSSTRQTQAGTTYTASRFDPHQTIRPPRTSSIQRRPTVIPTQAKAKSTSYYTKTSGALATSTTTGRRGAENTTSRKARDKTDNYTQSAQEYQDRMDSRATKTSEELMAEALEERRRSKKDRTVTSEPTPKSRSGNMSQSRHSRAGSSVSRTGTDMDRPIKITMDGNNVGISGETGDRSIEIGTAEDGTVKVTVGSPTKRKEQSYHGGSSSHSRLSFADRARRRDSGLSAVDAQNEG